MTNSTMSTMFSSKTDLWATPQDLFDELNNEFHFDIDVCADESNHKCDKYYSKEQDGLKQIWMGTVWCNPPYGREISKWVEKGYNSHRLYNNCIVMLLHARTDTKWFHDYIYGKAEIRFIRGRLRFTDDNGNAAGPAPFPSMVVIYNRETAPIMKIPQEIAEKVK